MKNINDSEEQNIANLIRSLVEHCRQVQVKPADSKESFSIQQNIAINFSENGRSNETILQQSADFVRVPEGPIKK